MKKIKIKVKEFFIFIYKSFISMFYLFLYSNQDKEYIEIKLKGGLCNKLFCLFSACDISIRKNFIIIEPTFGWKRRIKFSDIYDIDFFNQYMTKHNRNEKLMISRKRASLDPRINSRITNINIDLYKYATDILDIQRQKGTMPRHCMNIQVLNALKLNQRNLKIVIKHKLNSPFTAIQVRTESDWVNYAQHKIVEKDEILLISIDELIARVKNFKFAKTIFFTTGENHSEIAASFRQANYTPKFYYNPNIEYEINAAINFELCCNAKYFIGLSRSTYSNLISLKRAINGKENSYIYNYRDNIYLRKDKGLQVSAKRSISKSTEIY